ncbi:MAG: cobalt-zinc-cadmium resistance protein [Candidatus Fluviicola riflensis]|nr:MAG: cation-efflux pump [Candidatus Fluviicola riflensis]OGS78521.1 MAG: cobalt-zinc-cadmium resistance protein [Candidatus Fluviicola riflensis]OGS84387.1 MAG: cobalt-zinc-cadmium resistance protein [Fluviicola sp. RIFCSPHIGHO2_12_FULL_43_24]OGS85576.1 MAG: cobalt-zinc-cadmium resistance protein [Fluviicola sp. RIFCSPHIGHO2_01_FULL_43_53]
MKEQQQKAISTAYFSMFGNLILALTKGAVGFFGNSFALIADAIESTADVFSSFLVLVGLKYAKRPPDENHPYGHGKVEPLITFVVVGFLCISATYIVIESIHNIRTPHKVPQAYTLWFLAAIIVIKELSYRFVSKKSKETGSGSLKADAWHHRSDAITSLCAFVGISIALWLGNDYAEADDWAALLSSGFIYVNAFLIFRPALGEVMDEHRHHAFVDDIRTFSQEVPHVVRTEKCLVRKSGMRYWVDIHVHVDGKLSVDEGHTIAHTLKSHLMEKLPVIEDVLVHIEPA